MTKSFPTMAGFHKALMRFLRGDITRRDRFDHGTINYTKVDVDRTADELNLAHLAQVHGSHELPASDATVLDGPQETILQFIDGDAGIVLSGYEKRLTELNREIQAIDLRLETERMRSLDQILRRQLTELVAELGPAIQSARQLSVTAQNELREFKLKNKINREPDYPDTKLLLWAMLFFACIAEALVNAFFFQQGLMTGLVGGALMALILASVDIAIVYWLGRGSAWIISQRWRYRTIGLLCGLLFCGWVVFYNLLTAHIREQLTDAVQLQTASGACVGHFSG